LSQTVIPKRTIRQFITCKLLNHKSSQQVARFYISHPVESSTI